MLALVVLLNRSHTTSTGIRLLLYCTSVCELLCLHTKLKLWFVYSVLFSFYTLVVRHQLTTPKKRDHDFHHFSVVLFSIFYLVSSGLEK